MQHPKLQYSADAYDVGRQKQTFDSALQYECISASSLTANAANTDTDVIVIMLVILLQLLR